MLNYFPLNKKCCILILHMVRSFSLCMYVCLLLPPHGVEYIYLSCSTYTAVNQIACGLWGTTCSLSSIEKGLFSY